MRAGAFARTMVMKRDATTPVAIAAARDAGAERHDWLEKEQCPHTALRSLPRRFHTAA